MLGLERFESQYKKLLPPHKAKSGVDLSVFFNSQEMQYFQILKNKTIFMHISRPLLLFIFGLFAATSTLNAQKTSAFQKASFVDEAGTTLPYRILYPENYDPQQSYPLLVFLHGSGERGTDNEAQLTHGTQPFLDPEFRATYPAFVVFPQCAREEEWSELDINGGQWSFPFREKPTAMLQAAIELIDHLEDTLTLDRSRFYLGGLSMGGFGAFDWLARQPQRFAAAFPICGGGHPGLTKMYAPQTPLWIFHGAEDKVVPADLSRAIVKSIEEQGVETRYNEYPGVGHNSWDNAFAEPQLLPWLFSQQRISPQHRYVRQVFEELEKRTYTYAIKGADTLDLDVYFPTNDQETDRPLLLYMHGGGFAIGKRDEPGLIQFAKQMARRGYVVASMSYRLTLKGQSFSCDQATANKLTTFRKAVADIRDATNFLLSKSGEIPFNEKQVVIAGSSAGAEAVLHAAYWQDEDLKSVNFAVLPDQFRYAAVVSMAGAIVDTTLITKDNAIPTILYHGTCDPLVPYASAPHHYCEPGAPGYLMLHGGASIADHLEDLDQSFALYTSCGGEHEWNDRPLFVHVQELATLLANTVVSGQKTQIRAILEHTGACNNPKMPACQK